MKEIQIAIPEGYEIDSEKSTDKFIVCKKIESINKYEDLKQLNKAVYMNVLDEFSAINCRSLKQNADNRKGTLNLREAKKQRAIGMISQLLPYYGGFISKEEWSNDNIKKHIIKNYKNTIHKTTVTLFYEFLAFYTEEDRDRFIEHNEQIVKDYLMIIQQI